ncbi:MAG: WecB/TagA/CpsF family glycosyltransferase [Terriglobales bacterium]
MRPFTSVPILGSRLDVCTRAAAIERLDEWIRQRAGTHVCHLTNVHMVVEACRSSLFREVVNAADLNLTDGSPLTWLARIRRVEAERNPGPDVMSSVVAAGVPKGYRHFLYGGVEGVPQDAAAELRRRFPGAIFVGAYSPPFRPLTLEEDEAVVKMINDSRPDVLWVGLGCPKQERWMSEHRDRLRVPVMLGVGQAFDIYARRLRRAPDWICTCGCEWLFRLCQEPRRLWKRYLVYNSLFLLWLALELLNLKDFN